MFPWAHARIDLARFRFSPCFRILILFLLNKAMFWVLSEWRHEVAPKRLAEEKEFLLILGKSPTSNSPILGQFYGNLVWILGTFWVVNPPKIRFAYKHLTNSPNSPIDSSACLQVQQAWRQKHEALQSKRQHQQGSQPCHAIVGFEKEFLRELYTPKEKIYIYKSWLIYCEWW